MLRLEFEPATVDAQPCECCGGRTTRLTRFVYCDGNAHAAYYAIFSDNHPFGFVSVLISIGEWGDDAPPDHRCAFYLRIRATNANFQVSVCNADESPWGNVDVFGRTLDREEALQHPRLNQVFEITDQIVAQDAPVIEYLSKNGLKS